LDRGTAEDWTRGWQNFGQDTGGQQNIKKEASRILDRIPAEYWKDRRIADRKTAELMDRNTAEYWTGEGRILDWRH
jgi:hypothetical protein